jgi:hypothetical protein
MPVVRKNNVPVLFRHLPARTEQHYNMPQSENSVSRPRFVTGTAQQPGSLFICRRWPVSEAEVRFLLVIRGAARPGTVARYS